MSPKLFPYSNDILACWSGNKIGILNLKDDTKTIHEVDGIVNDLKVWNEKIIILVDKSLRICSFPELTQEKIYNLIRRPSCCKVFKNECFIADKSGDVYKIDLENGDNDALKDPILGHVSLILSIDVDEKFIYTAEQDEKIKVSSRPHPFVIDRYLLGHTAFVDTIISSSENSFSTSGDGTVKLWKDTKCIKELKFEGDVFTHALSVGEDRLGFCVSNYDNTNARIIIADLELKILFELALDYVLLDICLIREDIFLLVENESRKISVLKLNKENKKNVLFEDIVLSDRDVEKWTKLKKELGNNKDYDKYLEERKNGFQNSKKTGRNNSGKSKKRARMHEPRTKTPIDA